MTYSNIFSFTIAGAFSEASQIAQNQTGNTTPARHNSAIADFFAALKTRLSDFVSRQARCNVTASGLENPAC